MRKITLTVLLFLVAILPWLFISKFTLMKDPPIWPDEPVFSDTIGTLINSGKIATNIYGSSIKGMSEHAYWYPPLYFYALAGYIKMFGQNIEILRISSMVFAFFALLVFALILAKIFHDLKFVFLGTLMLSLDRAFMRSSHVTRMDMMAFLFFLAALFSFWWIGKKGKNLLYLLPGLAAALSFLTHPMGILVLPILVSFITVAKDTLDEKIKRIVYLLTPAVVASAFWLLSMAGDWDIFLYQFGLQFIRKAHLSTSLLFFASVDVVWRMLFIFYIAVLILQFFLWRKSKEMIFLTGIIELVITVTFLALGKDIWYFIYLPPFIILAILSSIKTAKSGWKIKYILYLLPVVFLALNLIILIRENETSLKFNYNDFGQQISSLIPRGSRIFIAAIPDPYFALKAKKEYVLYEFPTEFIDDRDYLALLNKSDYIVFNLVPSKLAALYILRNRETDKILDFNEIKFHVIKLVPRDKRII